MRPGTLWRLERFNGGIDIIEELKGLSKESFLRDIKAQSLVERNLQVCIEFLIDHDLRDELLELVSLRNIIVHMCADIKVELVFDNLGKIVATLKRSAERILEFSRERGIDP
jgi:uncharacterized protein YutE (UPF0331/DUF86 family)